MKGPLVFGQEPIYTHNPGESKNLDYFTITSADAFNPQAKINRLVIAVDVAPNGEVFVLTFGDGIKKVGANGGLVNFIPNQSDRLSNALDFAINSDGKFFVATNESNRRFIRVYSPTGAYLSGETLGDGTYGTGPNQFKGPSGLTFDKDDNLFVADQYLGDADPPRPSAIKIYRKDAAGSYKNNLIQEFDNVQGTILNFPYRIAVNSQGQLYMSELGQTGDASVKIIEFDANFNPLSMSPGPSAQLGAPGSIVIDKFDNVFVADFGNEIDLPRILNATEDLDEFYAVFEIIINGIDNNVFKINVYNPDSTFNSIISSQIDFPIDLAISPCGTLYVNNAIFDGRVRSIFGFTVPDFTLDFDLEAYDRSAGYDTEDPVVLNCSNDLNVELTNGRFTVDDYRNLQSFSDNCDDDLEIIQSPPAGTSISQTTTVSITAKDDSGNESAACTFQLIITEEQQPPSFTCSAPGDLTLNIGADCSVNASDYSEYITNPENFQNGIRIEQEESVLGNIMTVTLTVFDGEEEVDTCTFEVTLLDVTAPEITSCDATSIEIELAAGESFTIQDYSSRISASDCDSNFTINQSPAEGAQITETTRVTLTATDGSGNESAACSFQVIITEEQQPPSFTCNAPVDLTLNIGADCSVNASDYSGYITNPENFQNGIRIEQEESVSGSIMTVTLTVFDGEEEVDTCTFEVTLLDVTAPEITSCDTTSIEIELAAGESFTIQDYSSRISASDCDSNFTINQSPAEGAQITETTTVTLTAIDGSGNGSNACSFEIIIIEEQQALQITNCPPSRTESLGNDCSFILPDYTNEAAANVEATFSQTPVAGTVITAATEVIIKAEANGETKECSFEVSLQDNIIPEISCPSDKTVNFDPAIGFTVLDYRGEAIASDNCSFEIVQDPPPGTVLFQSRWIFLTAIDASDNQIVCEFALNLTEGATPEISCKDVTIELDATGKANLDASSIFDGDFYDPSIRSFSLDKGSFDCSDIGVEVPVELTVEYMNGTTAQCTSKVTVVDNSDPVVNCVSTFTLYLNEEGYGILSPGILDRNSTDNCGIAEMKLNKTRFDNSDVGDQTIVLTVTDTSGNTETCETLLTVVPYGERTVTCAEEIDLPLDENGEATLKLTYTGNEENIEVVTSKTNFTCDDLGSEVVTATYIGEYSGSCEIQINILDNLPPQIDCVSSYTLRLNEQGTGTISEELLNLNYSDNCGVSRAIFSKTNFTTQDIGNNNITFTVNDSSGNESSCTINVMVIPFDYAGPDFECKDSFTLELNSNGQAFLSSSDVYTGEALGVVFELSKSMFTCSDIGSEEIEVSYSGSATGTCTLEVVVEDNLAPAISCVATLEVYLDQTGSATISPQDIDYGSTDNCSITSRTLSITTFSEADLGENTVTLTVIDASENISTCEATVIVKPQQGPAPVVCVESVVLELNSNGRVTLDPQQLFSGGPADLEYSVNRTQFTCLDLGEQNVVFTYSSESDSGSCEIPLLVIDPNNYCEEFIGGNGPFVILYPNPGNGEVSIKVSPGIILKRAEVFDAKGRFLLEKSFEENSAEDLYYRLNLTAFQSGVYTLMLYSQDKEYIRRAIIRND
ncbi:hypothetical protein GCM10010465_23670 [Actinomadura fibrosa]